MTTLSLAPRQFWQWLAYHHQAAEGSLYLMFFSGMLLWEPLTPLWPLARWNLFLHMMLSLTLFPLLFGVFWLSHRNLLNRSNKPFLRTTGRIIEALLLVCLASGLLLVLHGTPGDAMGNLASWAHWLSALLLTPLVMRHAWRWTILKWRS
ncbi:hypothetical protein LA366_08035 [Aeromonas jandaei]|uniref:DUF2919 domain-containing protein n=1 Tax=Aeromonas jandaei TaxID=650 RepID=A0A7T4AAJ3_AERJA|nr:hypothetical protein [Aeromonas jandaei]QQB20308.1 hypothetical protein I6H43_01815 [Aeromonas jandaei]UCA35004.1 hypothetical protein LA366_08035 [Aeromonas jandaei]